MDIKLNSQVEEGGASYNTIQVIHNTSELEVLVVVMRGRNYNETLDVIYLEESYETV